MSSLKKRNNLFIALFFGGFSLFGLIFIVASFVFKAHDNEFFDTAVPTTGVIEDVNSSSDNSSYTIVRFNANGKPYRATLGYYSSSMHIGDPIEIYYQPLNPLNIKSKEASSIGFWIFFALGSIFFLVGFVYLIIRMCRKSSSSRLIRDGIIIKADVKCLSENDSLSFNGSHPLVVHCCGTLPDGKQATFKSRSVWYTADELSDLRTVRVYVNPERPSSYYVDVDGSLNPSA